jgi:hypothetical protein
MHGRLAGVRRSGDGVTNAEPYEPESECALPCSAANFSHFAALMDDLPPSAAPRMRAYYILGHKPPEAAGPHWRVSR